MGDLRNKLAKQAMARELMARAKARERPAPPPPRCACGNTHLTSPHLWAWRGGDGIPAGFYCPACLPARMLPWVLPETVNNSESYLDENLSGDT